jgi:hypothetical protein
MADLQLTACPLCSHPPHLVVRPSCVRGVRSGRWMIVTGAGCPHLDIWRADNVADDPVPLVDWWNAWVRTEAAGRSAARGHTEEQAAAFLRALQPANYSAP